MLVWMRPGRVPLPRWDAMAAAFRTRDEQRIYALLGVAATAPVAEVEAAARRWGLEQTKPVAIGLKVISSARWRSFRPPIGVTAFDRAVATRRLLLSAIPAVEAYYVDHATYSGMTVSALRRIDPKLSSLITIVRATRAGYCVELTAASTTWSQAGPGGAPRLGHCR
jgi:hypothetical protein